MGADLLTAGFTIDAARRDAIDETALEAIIDTLHNDELILLDDSGGFDPEDIRDGLREGIKDYTLLADENHRYGTSFAIPGSTYYFTIAGGMSHGGAPFAGWDGLIFLLNLLDRNPAARACTDYVGSGIVTPAKTTALADALTTQDADEAAAQAALLALADTPTDALLAVLAGHPDERVQTAVTATVTRAAQA